MQCSLHCHFQFAAKLFTNAAMTNLTCADTYIFVGGLNWLSPSAQVLNFYSGDVTKG
jgi:hypothetical protein